MLPVMHTALQGIQSHQRGLQVVANNVANADTDGYRAQRYDPGSGQVRPRHEPLPPAPDAAEPPPSDVDLKRYELGLRANARVVQVADGLLGRLLDIFDEHDS